MLKNGRGSSVYGRFVVWNEQQAGGGGKNGQRLENRQNNDCGPYFWRIF